MIPISPDTSTADAPGFYANREVSDLAWACFSPPLLRAGQLATPAAPLATCPLALNPARRLWLAQLDREPGPLLAHLAGQRSRRLGLYFEHLWHFFLSQDPAIDLVAHNLPVYEAGQTLGEFDCLYFCRERQRHVHLELAVKFFLGRPGATTAAATSEWRDWLGPNSRDRLDLKLEHLLQRQLRLADQPAARRQLDQQGIRDLSRELVFKGYLFQPLLDPLPAPRAFNETIKLQQWLPIDQLRDYLGNAGARQYQVLPKPHWLSPAQARWLDTTVSPGELASQLHTHFARDTRPRLVAALDGQGLESQRFFVTATHWPNPDRTGEANSRATTH